MKKSIIITLTIIVLIAIAGTVFYTFRKSPDSVKNQKPDYILEAGDLVDAFFNDEDAANQKFLNKTLQVSSTVIEIEQGSENNTIVYLMGNDMGNISCQFSSKEISKAGIETGKQITVKGKCSGYILDVVLNKCAIVKE